MSTAKPNLPTGTVTFLFTDIEGSTQLARRLGPGYPERLAAHHRILRESIAGHRGMVVSTEGDAFFAVFPFARDAVAAAVDVQRSLFVKGAGLDDPIRVRIGMNTGEALLGGDNYTGLDLVRAARITGAAHGGQVLVSDGTRGLLADDLPDGAHLRFIGTYRLKDLAEPERLHQLEAAGLQPAFPPLRALDVRQAHLPPEATSFIGRAEELATVAGLLRGHRLVTLTGPGGSGKTRLAIRSAADVAGRAADGTFFVGLAAITAGAEVPRAVASAIGLPDRPDLAPADVVSDWLRDHEVLLVLDNLEQVEGAAEAVSALLGGRPGCGCSRRVVGRYASPVSRSSPSRRSRCRQPAPIRARSKAAADDESEVAAAALQAAVIATWLGDYATGRRMGEEAANRFRRIGDRHSLAIAMSTVGFSTIEVDPASALGLLEQSPISGDAHEEGQNLLARATAQFALGRVADARASLERSIERLQDSGDWVFVLNAGVFLARLQLIMGEVQAGMAGYRRTLEMSRALDFRLGVAIALEYLAEVSVWAGDVPRAVRLGTVAERIKGELGGGIPPGIGGALDPLAVGRAELSPETFEHEVAAGRMLAVDSAVAEALSIEPPEAIPPAYRTAPVAGRAGDQGQGARQRSRKAKRNAADGSTSG